MLDSVMLWFEEKEIKGGRKGNRRRSGRDSEMRRYNLRTFNLVFGVMILCILFFSFQPAHGQKIKDVDTPPETWGSPLVNSDYFSRDRDPHVAHACQSVEYQHLGKKFLREYASQQWESALDDLKFVLGYFPNHPKALMLMGSITQITKNHSLAIHYYGRALKLYPQYSLTHYQFGNFLIDIGIIDQGITELKDAIKINPKMTLAYAKLAEAYSKNGNLELARQVAEEARKLGYKGEIPGQRP